MLSAVRRIRRRLPQDGSVGPISYTPEIQETLTNIMNQVFVATKTLRLIARTAMQQTSLISGKKIFSC